MLKEIPKSDIIVRPMKVYKEWMLDNDSIYPIFAKSGSAGEYDELMDEKSHGHSKLSLFRSIKAQFYTNPATASILTEVGRRHSYASTNERVLETEMAVFSIKQQNYGEGIKPGSVILDDLTSNKVYTDDHYSNLVDATGSIVGNIFYDRGLVVLTKNVVSGSVLNTFTLEFRSTQTIFENEIFISVLESEFNYSQNPTAVTETDGRVDTHLVQRPGSIRTGDLVNLSFYNAGTKIINPEFDLYEENLNLDPTGSFLAPYITTIGLYDNDLNMVAVAKLPQPIKSTPDYPVNFIIRFDT
jgi:hypothetical protein